MWCEKCGAAHFSTHLHRCKKSDGSDKSVVDPEASLENRRHFVGNSTNPAGVASSPSDTPSTADGGAK